MTEQQENTSNYGKQRHPWSWVPSLYFIQGLPNAVIVTLTVILYKDFGISNTHIALYTGLMYLPWVLKPIWSPFVDIMRTKRWWIVTMQMLMAIAFAAVALFIPTKFYFAATVLLFWFAAFTSATNDIASDGFYIISLNEEQQSLFVGIRSLFYRISMWFVQFGLIFLAGYLQHFEALGVRGAWSTLFFILAAIFFVGASYHGFILPRPFVDRDREDTSVSRIIREFGETFVTFFRKPDILMALAFMLVYRLPEAQLVKMINPFLMDPVEVGGLGLTKEVISFTYGFFGAGGLILGGILGGVFAAKRGLKRSLRPMAWAMSLSCLTFVLLSLWPGVPLAVVDICVALEQFGYGFGFSAYMLYLIYFSEGKYATSHYAICTAFMAIGLMLPGMAAGWIADELGYSGFFLWTTLCCVGTIIVAYLVRIDK